MNLHNFFFGSSSIRKAVSPKENGFHFRLLIHTRGICTGLEMAIICTVRRLEFLKIVSDAEWRMPLQSPRLLTHMGLCVAFPLRPPHTGGSFYRPYPSRLLAGRNFKVSWLKDTKCKSLQGIALECQQGLLTPSHFPSHLRRLKLSQEIHAGVRSSTGTFTLSTFPPSRLDFSEKET